MKKTINFSNTWLKILHKRIIVRILTHAIIVIYIDTRNC